MSQDIIIWTKANIVDYLEGLGDSLDLVPIGAWWGQGRKAGWWSPILLACHNPETGALEAVCKCGLTGAQLVLPQADHDRYLRVY